MSIRLGPDVAAPAIVAVVELVGETTLPRYSSWITYGMTILGYAAALTNKGGDTIKNIGVSSLPLTAKRIYDNVRTPAVTRSYRAAGAVKRYPGSAQEAPFAGVKLV
ncbi:MAG: hypothetical protein U1B77_02465 [Dehalococcoidales bacterium]|nr:hypothetical protein [Dehalococcoidales bacterium]